MILNKIKKILKMDKEIPKEESLVTREPINTVTEEEMLDAFKADTPDDSEELEELEDTSFLETSAEAVGFENRESQWDTYRVMSQYITPEDSILDFGCGRGDFRSFYLSEFETDLTYTGIDFNPQLIDAGKKVNPETNIIHTDWKVYEGEADWCISIGSHDVRYDADSVMSDLDYLKNTIKKMYQSCNSGLAIMLASDTLQQDDGIITWSAPDALDYALKEFGTASIDHSYSDALFTLIIYKN
jgi:SAM-dependent methyltransferase